MMEINWLEWLGYLASLLVLVSLLMSSIIKLRWINLVGALTFAVYGYLLGAWPVAFMNAGIVVINIYYLAKIYRSKESFKIMPMERDSQYFKEFLNFYKEDIAKFQGNPDLNIDNADERFYITRNMVPAGVVVGSKFDENTLNIELDYVIPQYRDFKIGSFVFEQNKDYFTNKGYKRVVTFASNDAQGKYLNKMGFEQSTVNGKTCFSKSL